MALEDVIEEIKNGAKKKRLDNRAPKESKASAGGSEKPMTKAEIEAYRQRMIAKEEAKYLGKASAPKSKPVKKEKSVGTAKKSVPKANPESVRAPRMPKAIQPLQPLYLLKIPGLPKGDCIAICLAHGVDA